MENLFAARALMGLPFWLEEYAFFLEAIFLGLYAYGGKRLSRRALFLCTIPLTMAAEPENPAGLIAKTGCRRAGLQDQERVSFGRDVE